MRSTTVRQAGLDDPSVPSCGRRHRRAFGNAVRDRRFDVCVLARVTRANRNRCVPVIRRGDHDGINRSIIKQPPKVRMPGRSALLQRGDLFTGRLQHAGINVAQCSDLHVPKAGQRPRQFQPSRSNTDDAQPNAFRSRVSPSRTRQAHDASRYARGVPRAVFQKPSAIDFVLAQCA